MESKDIPLRKTEILDNLEITKGIINRNITANSKLDIIKSKIVDTSIKLIFIIIASIAAYLTLQSTVFFVKIINVKFIPFLLIIIGVLTIIVFFVIKNYGKNLEKKVIKKRFEKQEKEINEINLEIKRIYIECSEISILPEKYWDTQIVEKLTSYFKDERADSLKEALNLYEDELLKIQQMNLLNEVSQSQKSLIRAQKFTNTQLFLNSLSNISKK